MVNRVEHNKIINPILRGFHPDPSIVRVDEDYYIATSTFEWWPGVSIHHSKDLCHWELLTYPLTRVSQLDLKGVGPSQGVWAPCLTYDNGLFYLLYTVVKAFYCNMYDTHNYLVTAEHIEGPWSEPVPLNNFGFDPSMFHDVDGRKYMVSMVTDHRIPKKYAGRLVLQEYLATEKKMIGEVKEIYAAKDIFLEGPHIFKKGDYYYLFSADTGTGEGHGQSIARSRSVWGPYEMYKADFMVRTHDKEAYSILTSRHQKNLPLQKAGHSDLVETQHGEWYAVHLCGRPLENRNPMDVKRFPGERRYMLGRETAIQKMAWTKDGWLRTASGFVEPEVIVKAPNLEPFPFVEKPAKDDFDGEALDLEFQSLRVPLEEKVCSLKARKGYLRLVGGSGLASRFEQSLIARRLTEYNAFISTCVEFEPTTFKQMAGLIIMYDTDNYIYAHITHDEELGKCISILRAENKAYTYPIDFLPIEENKPIEINATISYDRIKFSYRCIGEENYIALGEDMDCSFLSDEACEEGWFTGTMTGICCQDLTGFGLHADFDWFTLDNICAI